MHSENPYFDIVEVAANASPEAETSRSGTDLYLMRHFESEANPLGELEGQARDELLATLLTKHSSELGLTRRGESQAIATGRAIRDRLGCLYDQYLTSPYDRAELSALLIDLYEARWADVEELRERNHGDIEYDSDARAKLYATATRFATPPNGESQSDVTIRGGIFVDRLLAKPGRVFAVSHADTIRAIGEYIEGEDHIVAPQNGEIFHYSTRNPHTGETSDRFTWKQRITPDGEELHVGEWEEIVPKTYTNRQLREKLNRDRGKHDQSD